MGGLVRPESGNTASQQLREARGVVAIALLRAEADLVRRAVEQLEANGHERRLAQNSRCWPSRRSAPNGWQ